MATAYMKGGASQPLPLRLIGQAIPMLTRHELASLAERLVDALDMLDAPTEDLEPEPIEDGDEDCCLAGDDGEHWKRYARTCGPLIDQVLDRLD